MSTMLELYRHRFGAGVKARGNGWNGPCPICGGEVGKSDRFMIWPDRERDLGYTCTENHILGVFSCRRCGRTGDSIRYMMDIEGMSFREACAEHQPRRGNGPARPAHHPRPRCVHGFHRDRTGAGAGDAGVRRPQARRAQQGRRNARDAGPQERGDQGGDWPHWRRNP